MRAKLKVDQETSVSRCVTDPPLSAYWLSTLLEEVKTITEELINVFLNFGVNVEYRQMTEIYYVGYYMLLNKLKFNLFLFFSNILL